MAPGVSRVRPAVFRSLSAAPAAPTPPAPPSEGPVSRRTGALRAYAPATAEPGGAADKGSVRRGAPPAPAARPLAPDADLERHLAPLRGLSRELVARGMPASLAAELLAEIVAEFGNQVLASEQDARLALVEQMLLRIEGQPLIPQRGPLTGAFLVAGPGGSGKSVLLAHLALAAAERGQTDVVLVNTEDERIGAAAQMNALGTVFGFPVEHLYTPQELRALQDRSGPDALLLIEAAGWSPSGGINRQRNAWTWQLPGATNVVCVPAAAQTEDLHELLSTVRKAMISPIAALTRTGDTRNQLPALSSLAALHQPVGMVVPGPNPLDAGPAIDLSMIARAALGVVTSQRKKGRVWA